MAAATATFERHRQHLTRHAYRMLGSLADAEDVVQDAYLRWHAAMNDDIVEPRAYLTRVVTRLCLDILKSARRRRESYVGPWLPEPIIELLDAPEPISVDDRIDAPVALMLALERLSPLERAAFLLHDVLDMDFSEIAATLDRSQAACRQLAARARVNVRADEHRYEVPAPEAERIASAFLAAVRDGDVGTLRDLLADAAVFHSDGGGQRPAALRIIAGRDRIVRFFAGLARKARTAGATISWSRIVRINGLPGYVSIGPDGVLQTTALQVEDGAVTAVYVVRNPDKLTAAAALAPPTGRT